MNEEGEPERGTSRHDVPARAHGPKTPRNTNPPQPAAGRDVPRSETQQADAAPRLQLIMPVPLRTVSSRRLLQRRGGVVSDCVSPLPLSFCLLRWVALRIL